MAVFGITMDDTKLQMAKTIPILLMGRQKRPAKGHQD
jgi:hypothetical protein